ncbi:MAG: pilin [Candidatus Paceibacterota bacterium]|jgi:hypothetical protein
MTFKNRKTISILVSLVVLLLPMIVLAEYNLLEPSIVGQSGTVASPGINTYLGWLYNAFFAIIAIITFMLIVSGGVDYVTSSIPSVKANGKEKIQRALKGFILALVAWLILETISSGGTFTNFQLDLENVGNGTVGSAGPTGNPTGSGNTNPGGNTGSGATGQSNITEADARKTLSDMGIGINADPPKTTLEGIQPTTIDGLKQIQADCPTCSLTVTDGTRKKYSTDPYSHSNGYKVDLRPTAEVDNYFSGWTYTGRRRDDNAPMYKKGKMTVADERNIPGRGAHWDLKVEP